ncbi:hypothetical protein SKAU_G00378500 [Synaphobranchus kaupii]|uniref:Uncharacterized protein n=1 Tax=Synaphobranchus kaupii TaxID=118154 RepID=A0A9Q1IDK6_SYNKA|nr:hypothetical protein SKAU_G00378500 [Synaphobranchus kaupii]
MQGGLKDRRTGLPGWCVYITCDFYLMKPNNMDLGKGLTHFSLGTVGPSQPACCRGVECIDFVSDRAAPPCSPLKQGLLR